MYWDIDKSIVYVVNKLAKVHNSVRVVKVLNSNVLAFDFSGKDEDVLRFPNYNIVFHTNLHEDKVYDSSYSRIIKCKNVNFAIIVAVAMLGEEVYAQERLSEIISLDECFLETI